MPHAVFFALLALLAAAAAALLRLLNTPATHNNTHNTLMKGDYA